MGCAEAQYDTRSFEFEAKLACSRLPRRPSGFVGGFPAHAEGCWPQGSDLDLVAPPYLVPSAPGGSCHVLLYDLRVQLHMFGLRGAWAAPWP